MVIDRIECKPIHAVLVLNGYREGEQSVRQALLRAREYLPAATRGENFETLMDAALKKLEPQIDTGGEYHIDSKEPLCAALGSYVELGRLHPVRPIYGLRLFGRRMDQLVEDHKFVWGTKAFQAALFPRLTPEVTEVSWDLPEIARRIQRLFSKDQAPAADAAAKQTLERAPQPIYCRTKGHLLVDLRCRVHGQFDHQSLTLDPQTAVLTARPLFKDPPPPFSLLLNFQRRPRPREQPFNAWNVWTSGNAPKKVGNFLRGLEAALRTLVP